MLRTGLAKPVMSQVEGPWCLRGTLVLPPEGTGRGGREASVVRQTHCPARSFRYSHNGIMPISVCQ